MYVRGLVATDSTAVHLDDTTMDGVTYAAAAASTERAMIAMLTDSLTRGINSDSSAPHVRLGRNNVAMGRVPSNAQSLRRGLDYKCAVGVGVSIG